MPCCPVIAVFLGRWIMGQARDRGTPEERKAAAIARNQLIAEEREAERRKRERERQIARAAERERNIAEGRPAPVTRPGIGVSRNTLLAACLLAAAIPSAPRR